MPRPENKERNLALVAMYRDEGMSIVQLEKYFRISRQRVFQILQFYNVDIDKRNRRSVEKAERNERVKQALLEGKTYVTIADELKKENISISKSTVGRIALTIEPNGKQ